MHRIQFTILQMMAAAAIFGFISWLEIMLYRHSADAGIYPIALIIFHAPLAILFSLIGLVFLISPSGSPPR